MRLGKSLTSSKTPRAPDCLCCVASVICQFSCQQKGQTSSEACGCCDDKVTMSEISNYIMATSATPNTLANNVDEDPRFMQLAQLKQHEWLFDSNFTVADIMTSSGLGSDSHWFEPGTEAVIVAAFCLVILMGVVGNAMVVFVLCRRGHLRRTPRHWFLMNLVVSDLLICVLCVPFTVLRLTVKDWRFGEAVCRLTPFLQQTYVLVSILTIVAIAVERYRAIVCSTQQSPGSTGSNVGGAAKLIIAGIWVLSIGLATPMAVTHKLDRVYNLSLSGEEEHVLLTLCVEAWDNDTLLAAYTVLLLLLQYALPAAAIMVLHLLICRFLRRSRLQAQRAASMSSAKASQRKVTRHRKNLALLTIISITFDMEWLPITVVNIIADIDHSVFPSIRLFSLTYALCLLLALTSVFVNPVVYGCFNTNFRRDLCRWIGGGDSNDRSGATCTVRHGSSDGTSRLYTTMVGSSSIVRQRSVSVDSNLLNGVTSSGAKTTTTDVATSTAETPGEMALTDARHILHEKPIAPVAPYSFYQAIKRRRNLRCGSLDTSGVSALLTTKSEVGEFRGVNYKSRKMSLQSELERVIE